MARDKSLMPGSLNLEESFILAGSRLTAPNWEICTLTNERSKPVYGLRSAEHEQERSFEPYQGLHETEQKVFLQRRLLSFRPPQSSKCTGHFALYLPFSSGAMLNSILFVTF